MLVACHNFYRDKLQSYVYVRLEEGDIGRERSRKEEIILKIILKICLLIIFYIFVKKISSKMLVTYFKNYIFNQNKCIFLLKIQPFEMPIPVEREDSYKVHKDSVLNTWFSILDIHPP